MTDPDHATDHIADGGLFDLPDTTPARPTGPEPDRSTLRTAALVINDMNLIQEVLTRATEPGYVLLHTPGAGAGERVWRRRGRRGEDIEPVPTGEADAVWQLLEQRFLARGGTHKVRRGSRTGAATSVLLTDAARTRLRRWRAYTRPTSCGLPPGAQSAV